MIELTAFEPRLLAGPDPRLGAEPYQDHVRRLGPLPPAAGLVDVGRELARTNDELADAQKHVRRLEGQLASDFGKRAPAEVVGREDVLHPCVRGDHGAARIGLRADVVERLVPHEHELVRGGDLFQ